MKAIIVKVCAAFGIAVAEKKKTTGTRSPNMKADVVDAVAPKQQNDYIKIMKVIIIIIIMTITSRTLSRCFDER